MVSQWVRRSSCAAEWYEHLPTNIWLIAAEHDVRPKALLRADARQQEPLTYEPLLRARHEREDARLVSSATGTAALWVPDKPRTRAKRASGFALCWSSNCEPAGMSDSAHHGRTGFAMPLLNHGNMAHVLWSVFRAGLQAGLRLRARATARARAQRTRLAVPLLRHGNVTDALVVRVGAEVRPVRDVVEVLDAVPRRHVPAKR